MDMHFGIPCLPQITHVHALNNQRLGNYIIDLHIGTVSINLRDGPVPASLVAFIINSNSTH